MSLQFILGTGSQDHRQTLVAEAKKLLESQQQVFFLVPNYNKFEQEREILQLFSDAQGEVATINLQVFSFQRLAWYFLQQSPDFIQSYLTESSSSMIFRKILASHENQLTVFRGEINKTGFIEQLFTLYRELLQGNLTGADLLVAAQADEKSADQKLKLQDLSIIMQAFEETLWQTQLLRGDLLDQLIDYLADQDLSAIHFLVTDFSRFSAKELKLIHLLMAKGSVTISLLLDKKAHDEPTDKINLFYDTSLTYYQLYQFARKQGIPVNPDLKASKSRTNPDLLALQHYWEASQSNQTLAKAPQKITDVHLLQAENLREEISWIGKKIRQKVIDENYRYQDIQILVRNQAPYSGLIANIFHELDIPFYLDTEAKMEQHPLVEFLSALFAIKNFDFRLNDVMRLLRTELLLPEEVPAQFNSATVSNPFRNLVDITENIALAYNFQGYSWKNDRDWQLYAYDFVEGQEENIKPEEQQANFVRNFVRQQLLPLYEKLEDSKTCQAAATVLYQFLVEAGVKKELLHWRSLEINQGDLRAARTHEQTWDALIHLLEEYVTIYGQEKFEWTLFQEVLEAGLENLTYGMIPSALDQVRINDLELARPHQAKITFAIGLNDQVLPQKIEAGGLLSSEDKQLINELFIDQPERKFLFDASTQGMNREPFTAYLIFLSATAEIYLSYASNQDTEKNLTASPYLKNIANYFKLSFISAKGLTLNASAENYLGTYRSLIGDLNDLQRQFLAENLTKDQEILLPQKWQVLRNILRRSSLGSLAEKTFSSLTYHNQVVPLTRELVQKIYGQELNVSVSRLENFFNCEYKYFATYGLALKEREIYGLSPAATGDFYHDSLDRLLKEIILLDRPLSELSDVQLQEVTEKILFEVLGEKRFAILNESNRMKYIRYQLKQTIHKVSWALQKQQQETASKTLKTEIAFGKMAGRETLPSRDILLNHGGKLTLKGIIDRVDNFAKDHDESPFVSVVDYKSSKHKFEIWRAYYGLAMQLLTYMDVVQMNGQLLTGQQDVQLAGAYYLHVRNPELKSAKDIEGETLAAFKYDGLFINDEKNLKEAPSDSPLLLELLAENLEPGASSNVFPLSKKKNGEVSIGRAKGKYYSQTEVSELIQHNQKNMATAGNRILSGEIALNPSYVAKTPEACQYCPFRSVCTFDVLMKGNHYHRLEKLSKEEVLKRVQAENNQGGELND